MHHYNIWIETIFIFTPLTWTSNIIFTNTFGLDNV